MKNPGCTIIGTVVAKPEKRDELMGILAAQVAPTRTELGCINYDFHCDKSDPNVFVFYENFLSKEVLDELLAKPVDTRASDGRCESKGVHKSV